MRYSFLALFNEYVVRHGRGIIFVGRKYSRNMSWNRYRAGYYLSNEEQSVTRLSGARSKASRNQICRISAANAVAGREGSNGRVPSPSHVAHTYVRPVRAGHRRTPSCIAPVRCYKRAHEVRRRFTHHRRPFHVHRHSPCSLVRPDSLHRLLDERRYASYFRVRYYVSSIRLINRWVTRRWR